MYALLAGLHNITRYALLILLIITIVRALMGWLQNKSYTEQDRKFTLYTTITTDVHLLLGLILYFVAGWFRTLSDMGTAMGNADVRFWAVEHISIGIIAVVLVHVGSSRAKKAKEAVAKHRATAIFFILALLVALSRMPWDRWIPFG